MRLPVLLALALPAASAMAQEPARSPWRPQAGFVQIGHAPRDDTQSLTLGLLWQAPITWSWGGGVIGLHGEIGWGRWSARVAGERRSSWVSQLSLTPTLRWSQRGDGGWFAQLGIGLNWIAPRYRSGDRHFSTAFNFGDHLGVGYRWAGSGQELALRIEHFSNAGIRRPNPGEDFLQLRWVQPF